MRTPAEPVYDRRMRRPRIPRDLLDPVVAYFKPQRVILFGSRARGEATRDSDIDLLVVVDDDTPPDELTSKAGYEAHRSRHAAYVFPMRAETFEIDRNIVGTLAAEADADGIVVYGSPKGASMKSADPRALWEAVEDWLEAGAEDRRVAASCLALDPPVRGATAFHCQQAIEKLLKGFLMLAATRSREMHSLAQLGAAAKDWSRWAVDFRYPTRRGRIKPEPDEDELRRALAVIDELASRLRANNPEPATRNL
jgi:HEPN domain-containing protein